MNDEKIQFVFEEYPRGQAVTEGPFNRNNHIPQDVGVKISELTFRLGKGNHVGGIIAIQITSVDFADLLVIDKDQTEFAVRDLEFPKDSKDYSPQPSPFDSYFFLPVFDQQACDCFLFSFHFVHWQQYPGNLCGDGKFRSRSW